jgi:hypothetical protein
LKDGKLPARASRIAATVLALGTKGSKGKTWSCATLVSIIRTASDTVKPIAASAAAASSRMALLIRVWTKALADMVILL